MREGGRPTHQRAQLPPYAEISAHASTHSILHDWACLEVLSDVHQHFVYLWLSVVNVRLEPKQVQTDMDMSIDISNTPPRSKPCFGEKLVLNHSFLYVGNVSRVFET